MGLSSGNRPRHYRLRNIRPLLWSFPSALNFTVDKNQGGNYMNIYTAWGREKRNDASKSEMMWFSLSLDV